MKKEGTQKSSQIVGSVVKSESAKKSWARSVLEGYRNLVTSSYQDPV